MHILILSQIFPPDLGGSATRAYNVAKGLLINDIDVTVITGFPHYPTGNVPKHLRKKALVIEHLNGMRIIRTYVPPLPAKGFTNRILLFISFLLSSLFSFLLIRKIDSIFASNPQVLSIYPALIYKLFHHCPIVLNVDDLWPEDIEPEITKSSMIRKFGEILAKIAYAMADAVMPISPGYVEVICNKYGVDSRKVCVVRGGVDLSKFKLAPPTNNSKFTVLYSGAFSVAYDFDQVLRAAKLLESYDDVGFVFQGGGELLDTVKRKVAVMGLKNVKIIDKILSRDEVAELLSRADVLLLPLRDFGKPYLGISSKLYECQAAGKPIICCSEGQPAEYVKMTSSGIVVKPGDHEALAKAVLELKEKPSLALTMGKNGRKYVEKEVSIEAIGRKIKNIFQSLLGK